MKIVKDTTKLLATLMLGGVILLSSCGDDGDDTSAPVTKNTTFKSRTLLDEDQNIAETIVTITDYGKGIGTTTLTKDKTWVLNGFVFVNAGQTLTIEPGTVVKGKSGQGENASALIVAKGGTIDAEGTATEPIIFTAEADGTRQAADGSGLENEGNLPISARGLWGGVIILGEAQLNSSPGTTSIEGIPTTEKRGNYGGTNDAHSSGTFAYASIRHGGTDIGAANEINGLTLGGVGTGTDIHHVEIIGNADDGIEFFGGKANTHHMLVVGCNDDGIDYDEGYRGDNQFIVVYQVEGAGDHGGEHDGGTSPEDGTPYAVPHFWNVTYSGRISGGDALLNIRDNAGSNYQNSIFTNWKDGIEIEDLASGQDSKARLDAGDIKIQHNIFWNVAGDDAAKFLVAVGNTTGDLSADANLVGNIGVDPQLNGLVPASIPAVTTNTNEPSGSIFVTAGYKGAFEPGTTPWYEGWTLTDAASVIQ